MNRKYDCLFADDIRNEIGGKHSIIGVYNTALSLDSAQTLIPKLAISLNCYTDFDHPFKQLFVMVMLDDAVISQNELPAQFLEKSFNENKKMIEECGIPLASQFYRAPVRSGPRTGSIWPSPPKNCTTHRSIWTTPRESPSPR